MGLKDDGTSFKIIRWGLQEAGKTAFIDTGNYRIKDRTTESNYNPGEPLIKFHEVRTFWQKMARKDVCHYYMNVTDRNDLPTFLKFLKGIHFQTEDEFAREDRSNFFENSN